MQGDTMKIEKNM